MSENLALAERLTPKTLDEMMALAKILAESDLVPKDYKGKPGNILIAVQLGAEVGLKWAQALQSIAVIGGRPSLWGDAGLAIVMTSPEFEGIRETDDEATKTATCWLKRKGLEPVSRSFSQADAERIQVWERDSQGTLKRVALADRPVWKAGYQKRMRQMRARWWAMKDTFPDRLKGLEGREWIEADLGHEAESPNAPEEPARSDTNMAPRRKSDTTSPVAQSARLGAADDPQVEEARQPVAGEIIPPPPETAEATENVPAKTGKATATGDELFAAPPAQAESPVTTFTIGDHMYETAGITRDQLLECFRLSEVLKKKAGGAGLDKAILKKEFGLTSRTRLTAEDAEKYIIRLREVAEA